MGSKRRVAILGGGMASLTTAYELSRPELQEEFDITVYQLGWRLGGKGASGRNPEKGNRIEEHGLHLWMGCYENAFRVIRDCYADLARSHEEPLPTWVEAFKPANFTVLEDCHDGRWYHWRQRFPQLPSTPGESEDVASPLEIFGHMTGWLLRCYRSSDELERWTPPNTSIARKEERPIWLRPFVSGLSDGILGGRERGSLGRMLERIEAIAFSLPDASNPREPPVEHRAISWLLKRFRALVALTLGWRASDPEARRLWITLDFISTNAIGMLDDGLLLPCQENAVGITYQDWLSNLERIDHLNYPDWLKQHGARDLTVRSPIIRGLGDAIMSSHFPGSAGSALNGVVRLNLTYRGSIFYRMQAGMGETVFVPLYEVLKRRGVKFEFFSRVDGLHLDEAKQRVGSLTITRQVALADGRERYDPLIAVDVGKARPLWAWPSEPDWRQIQNGAELRLQGVDLESPAPVAGEHTERIDGFDVVVLGISLGGLLPLTRELADHHPPFRRMLESLRTTRTQSLQLWWNKSLRELGWEDEPAIVTSYAESLDTWADMSHLIPQEHVPGCRSISYFCGSLDDAGPGEEQKDRVRYTSMEWLRQNLEHLLPKAARQDRFSEIDWSLLIDPEEREGPDRLFAQYWRANVHPSDRYVLSVPGTSVHRLRATESGFENLVLAGDWVRTGMNVGCVEAAVMAGLQAARGVLGRPIRIIGDIDG